ncbi:MAG: hypothetical protein ACXAEU_19705 [Candidatus Hodarchaeales archaeon]|jgi:predicted ArsR family transcriptional regulator
MSELTTIHRQETGQDLSRDTRNKPVQKKSDRVVEILEMNGPLTRKDIMILSGYAWSTIYDILYRLEMKGKVNRYSQRIKRGRPKVYWKI